MWRAGVLAAGVGALLAAAPVCGEEPVPGPRPGQIAQATLVQIASGVGAVSSIANAGDARLFLALRTGQVVVWDGRGVLPRSFLNVSKLVSSSGMRGLLSVAFHPRYADNRLFFVGYTDAKGNFVLARYRQSAADPNRADPKSGVVLLSIPIPADTDHVGGELQFGPDGYLYVGIADGGSGDGVACNAQRDDLLLGKILRLDVNRHAAKPPYYAIPKANPFGRLGRPLGLVWAKGLRDPRRFSFDRATGDLYIGDVGQTAREEIDFQAHSSSGGENYGWGIMEGSLCAGPGVAACPNAPPCKSSALQLPVVEYGHESGDCAVVGGLVYRGSQIPGIAGLYFYGDSCSGHVWGDGRPIDVTASGLTTFGEDAAGEIYVGTGNGALYQLMTWRPVLTATVPERPPYEPPPPLPPMALPLPASEPATVFPGTVWLPSSFKGPATSPGTTALEPDGSSAQDEQAPPQEAPPEEAPPPDGSSPAPTPAPSPPDRAQPAPPDQQRPPTRTVNPH